MSIDVEHTARFSFAAQADAPLTFASLDGNLLLGLLLI